MTKIKKVKNKAGDLIFPLTHFRAVKDDNGNTLESIMQSIEDDLQTVDGNLVSHSAAFDVSAYNNASYANLAAALAAVPDDWKAPGMSIRFNVTGTSDYVQYRFTKSNTAGTVFTNTANWDDVTEISDIREKANTALLTTAQTLTDAEKAQALANVGIAGVDDEPTAGSDKLVKSGGVYNNFNLTSIKDVNDFIVDIVLKDGVTLDWEDVKDIAISDLSYDDTLNKYYLGLSIRYNNANKPSFLLFYEWFNTYDDGLSLFGKLVESDYCYVIVKHIEDGRRINKVSQDIFNRSISWDDVNEHPIIKNALNEAHIITKQDKNNLVTKFSDNLSDDKYPSEKLVYEKSVVPFNNFKSEFLSEVKHSVNIYDYANVGVVEGIINTLGNLLTTYENSFATGLIPVKPNHFYYLSNRYSKASRSIRCLASDGETKMKVLAPANEIEYSTYYLPNDDATKDVPNGQFKTPANAAYVQMSLTRTNGETPPSDFYKIMLEDVGDTYNPNFQPSEYEPYIKPQSVISDDKLQYPVKKEIKILCFGSSFTQDCMSYVPFVTKNIATDVKLTLGIAYIGGSPLVQHAAYLTGETFESDGVRYYTENGVYKKENIETGEVQSYNGYVLYKSINGNPWTNDGYVTSEDALANEEWDIVTFQGSAAQSHKDWATYYAPYLFKLQKAFYSKISKNTQLGWILIHSGYEKTDAGFVSRFEATAENTLKVMAQSAATILFPYGAAIQNLRTIETLRNLGDNTYHNLLADTAHIQEGIGCLAAAYANALTILKVCCNTKVGIIGETTRPDDDWITDKNIPGAHIGSGVIGITEHNCFLAQIAAIQAVKNPYEITDINDYNI